jgi:hypothetical protein
LKFKLASHKKPAPVGIKNKSVVLCKFGDPIRVEYSMIHIMSNDQHGVQFVIAANHADIAIVMPFIFIMITLLNMVLGRRYILSETSVALISLSTAHPF